jgi:hypothetical protein
MIFAWFSAGVQGEFAVTECAGCSQSRFPRGLWRNILSKNADPDQRTRLERAEKEALMCGQIGPPTSLERRG